MARKRKQSNKLPEAPNTEAPKETGEIEIDSSVAAELLETAAKSPDGVITLSPPKEGTISTHELVKTSVKTLRAKKVPKVEEKQEPIFEKQTQKPYATTNPDDVIIDIRDAATSMLDGYKDNWLSALKVRAKQIGLGERATRREWRSLFISWGGPQILK